MTVIHETIPILVWVDIDVGIVDFVRHLNTMPGIRTHSACQGTIGEGGQEPYAPFVMVSWLDDEARRSLEPFGLDDLSVEFGYVHPPATEPAQPR